MRPLLELGLVTNEDAAAPERNGSIAFKLLQYALYNFAHGPHHGGNLLVRDPRAGFRRLLDDVLVAARTAEK